MDSTKPFVTINGTALRGYGARVASVSLANYVAVVVRESDKSVVVAAASGPLSQSTDAVIVTGSNGATVTQGNAWTYLLPGPITDVSPSGGFAEQQHAGDNQWHAVAGRRGECC